MEYPRQLEKIRFTWDNLGLQDSGIDLKMYPRDERTDMIQPPSRREPLLLPRVYDLELVGGEPTNKTAFLICSQTPGAGLCP